MERKIPSPVLHGRGDFYATVSLLRQKVAFSHIFYHSGSRSNLLPCFVLLTFHASLLMFAHSEDKNFMRGLGPSLAQAAPWMCPGSPNKGKPDQEKKWTKNPSTDESAVISDMLLRSQVIVSDDRTGTDGKRNHADHRMTTAGTKNLLLMSTPATQYAKDSYWNIAICWSTLIWANAAEWHQTVHLPRSCPCDVTCAVLQVWCRCDSQPAVTCFHTFGCSATIPCRPTPTSSSPACSDQGNHRPPSWRQPARLRVGQPAWSIPLHFLPICSGLFINNYCSVELQWAGWQGRGEGRHDLSPRLGWIGSLTATRGRNKATQVTLLPSLLRGEQHTEGHL